jgi:hypothetical protein
MFSSRQKLVGRGVPPTRYSTYWRWGGEPLPHPLFLLLYPSHARTFHAKRGGVRPPPFVKDLQSAVPCASDTAATCDKHGFQFVVQ